MSRHRALLTGVACALALVVSAQLGAARTEAVLSWDDGAWGSYDDVVTGFPGQKLAVRFRAPEWAEWVTEIRYFIGNDLIDDPVDPELPTTKPFLAYVWTPGEGDPTLPDVPANEGVNSGELYPEEEWLHVVLPQAVNISDPVEFPDRVFFVGLEWLNRLNPYVGEDYTPPIDHMSWRFNWAVWELRENADTMIRAVVTDTWTSPVESGSWSRVKALYR